MMKKIIALAAMISASTFAAGAYAQDTGVTAPTASASEVTIVNVANPPSSGSGTTPPVEVTSPTAEMTQAAQAQVRNDPALMTALEENNVQLNNVVAIQTAASGGKTVYVK
jgi:hypothetical protein